MFIFCPSLPYLPQPSFFGYCTQCRPHVKASRLSASQIMMIAVKEPHSLQEVKWFTMPIIKRELEFQTLHPFLQLNCCRAEEVFQSSTLSAKLPPNDDDNVDDEDDDEDDNEDFFLPLTVVRRRPCSVCLMITHPLKEW